MSIRTIPDAVFVIVFGLYPEARVLGAPGVDHRYHGDMAVAENQGAWRLLAGMADVALDTDGANPLPRAWDHGAALGDDPSLLPHAGIEAEGL